MLKLYKFRPLATCQDLVRAQEILETGKFWCSRFWELNDPMEAVYRFGTGSLTPEFTHELYLEKANHSMCSLSGEKAFESPIMWGYYANGFKGIAIELNADREPNIERIKYECEIAKIANDDRDVALKRILTTKLSCWLHEDEYRYLKEGVCGPTAIGRITAVYFGNPYKTAHEAEDAQRRPRVREYLCRVESLKRTAQFKGIQCCQVDVVHSRVQVSPPDGLNAPNV